MGMFDALFQESALDTEKDYLAGVAIPTFGISESMNFVECGTKGMVLVETGWLNICEGIKSDLFVDALDEADEGEASAEGEGEKKADEKKEEKKKNIILRALEKLKELVTKAFQTIGGIINDFLNLLKVKIKQFGKVSEEAVIKAWDARKTKPTYGAHFEFRSEDRGEAKFANGIKQTKIAIERIYSQYIENKTLSGEEDFAAMFKNKVGQMLVGATLTDKKGMAEMVATAYGEKKQEHESTLEDVKKACAYMNSGYSKQEKAARGLYKEAKKWCNDMIKNCNDMAKSIKKEKGEEFKKKAAGVDKCSKAIATTSGLLNSFTGAYCQLLKSEYTAAFKLVGSIYHKDKAPKEEKKEEKKEEGTSESTIEDSASLFGLDLI